MAIHSLRVVSSAQSVLSRAVITAAITWLAITMGMAIVILASTTSPEKESS